MKIKGRQVPDTGDEKSLLDNILRMLEKYYNNKRNTRVKPETGTEKRFL